MAYFKFCYKEFSYRPWKWDIHCLIAVSIELSSNLKALSMRLTKLLRFVVILSVYWIEYLMWQFTWCFISTYSHLPLCHNQLRIIIKPKPCIGVGPICSPQQVNPEPCQRIWVSFPATLYLNFHWFIWLLHYPQICYHVLGLVHGVWTPIPRAVRMLLSFHFEE